MTEIKAGKPNMNDWPDGMIKTTEIWPKSLK